MKLKSTKYTRRLLLLLSLSIALALLLVIFWDDESQIHSEVSNQLIELKELEARLDRDVLRVTSFLLSHYDSLSVISLRLKALEKAMRVPGQRRYKTLDASIAAYWDSMNEKLEVLEKIKFQAAVVRNGIHYLPLAADSVKQIDIDVYRQVLALLNELYVYDLFYSDSQLVEINKGVERLEMIRFSDAENQAVLNGMIFHIRANLDDLSELGELKRRYLSIASLEKFEQLHQRYEKHRFDETREKQIVIVTLSLVVFGLLLGLWYIVRSLHLAHHALNQSWMRLHDAVDNLSEAFALFDGDNRLVLFNRRYAEFYPWLKEKLKRGLSIDSLKTANRNRVHYSEITGKQLQGDLPEGRYLEKTQEGAWYLASNKPTSEGGMVCVRTDITDTKRNERQLSKLSRALEQSPASVVITSTDGTIEYVNPKFEAVSGYTAEEAIGQNPRILKSGNKSTEEYREMWNTLLEGREWRGNFHNRRKDGSVYWEAASISPLRDDSGKITHFIAVKEDVTAQKRAEDQLRMNATVFDTTSEGIMVTDADNLIKTVNPAFSRITGYEAEEVIGRSPKILSSGRHTENFYEQLWSSVMQNGYWSGEIWNRKKDGSVFPEWLSIAAIKSDDGLVKEYVAVFSDITKHKQDEEKIRYQANFDALTGLPNRSLLTDRLSQAILSANREKWNLGLLFIDLDQFKVVNDTFGHVVGDELLQQVAERIRECVREADTVARFGGDEFVILLQDIEDPDVAVAISSKVIEALTRSFKLYGREIFIGASIGITIYPEDAGTADTLLRNADMAMYQAKEHGRNTYQFFTASMQRQTIERQQLEQDLRLAIERHELEVYYQPVVKAETGKVSSLEALLRWNHPKKGQISPEVFIPIAEDSGLIGNIGKWVMKNACIQLSHWRQYGHEQLTIAVNLSSRQRELGFDASYLQEVLNETGLPADSITLEITESLLMRDTEETVDWLGSLKRLGVKLSVDDFGTGYSSLSYLKRFPVNVLKIDRSFVHDLPDDPESVSLVNTIIAMAKSLKLGLVAEGVENQEQVDFLLSAGCDLLQGFHFGRPMPAAALTNWLAGYRREIGGR
ncbi:MAG: EAL domain-containing protein [Candidatus Thiodiazotropha sp. (ex Monitilora ramsayi)]|nr:EAL domain-containing protein [Candidatus Thiodiazotropha sp. (ex Monitilora ramsayi)]